jgi:tetratricopeptide (TPR) repeat protein
MMKAWCSNAASRINVSCEICNTKKDVQRCSGVLRLPVRAKDIAAQLIALSHSSANGGIVGNGLSRGIVGGIFALSGTLLSTTTIAQQPPDWEQCSAKPSIPVDRTIAACTAIIEKVGVTPDARAHAYCIRGTAHIRLGHLDLAAADFNETVRISQNRDESYLCRGHYYIITRNFDKAIADYNKALKLNPMSVSVFISLGLAYRHKGEIDHAIEEYTRALRLDPKSEIALLNRGYALSTLNKYKEALIDYNEVIRLNPRNASAFLGRGVVHRLLGNLDQANADDLTIHQLCTP